MTIQSIQGIRRKGALRQAINRCAVAWVVSWAATASVSGGSDAVIETTPPVASSETQEPTSDSLSLGSQQVLQLAESGVEEEVILAYIENAERPFGFEAEDIIYLNDVGISAELVTAMLRRDAALRQHGIQSGTIATNEFVYDQTLYWAGTNVPSTIPQPV